MQLENTINLKDYTLLEKIGTGSFGEVYKVRENETGNIYAAKISSKPLEDNSAEALLDLSREVNIISKIKHPSILGFIGFSPVDFNNDPKPVIITEYIRNGTLYDIITLERKSLKLEEWNDTRKLINIYGIASAMSYLHSHKIIHRDLKPLNILIDDFLCPKIADFGFSKIQHTNEDSMTMNSVKGLKGSPLYMSPEVWDLEYSQASDVYAFGMIVFEIITAVEPFKNLDFVNISKKVQNGSRPKIDGFVPSSYRNLIESCWAQDQEERPSFDQIVEQLKSDQGFITEMVEEADFFDYVDYIENSKTDFDSKKNIIQIDKFILRKTNTFKKISINEMKENQKVNDEEEDDDEWKSDKRIFYDSEAGRFFDKDNNDVDASKAANYYKKYAKKGFTDEMKIYGLMLQNGHGVEINYSEAARYLKMAADKGDVIAMNRYAFMQKNGQGIEENKIEAARYFKMAACKGSLKSTYIFAVMLRNGEGIEEDKIEAARYFKIAADKGHIKSMNIYAEMQFNGEGIPINKAKAARYYKMAADKGNSKAMNNYAALLRIGHGVKENKIEAARYFKMAADKGNSTAMNSYAVMLRNGEGIEENKIEAARYFKMAADKGNSKAKKNYDDMLENGEIEP